mgnify:CR=1 FL=1
MDREPMGMTMHFRLRHLLIMAVMMTPMACAKETKPKDPKLAALQAELDAAVTTFDMNCKALEMYEHLDTQIALLEDRIKNDMDPQFVTLFEKASAHWREYRKAEADLAYDEYKQGTIRTLMRNGALIRLSKERLAYLQDSDPEGRYKEKTAANVGP